MTDRASVCCQVTIGAAIASLLVLSTIGILLADTSAWRSAGADLSPGTGQRQVGADKWSSGAASSDSGWMLAGELPTSSAPADGELFGADSDEALDAETTIARHDAPRPAQANGSGTLEDEASSSTNKTGKVNYMAMLGKRRSKRRVLATESRKPILNEFSFPANLVQGMRFVLMCQVLDGEPPIQIKWFKDDLELERDPQTLLVHVPAAVASSSPSLPSPSQPNPISAAADPFAAADNQSADSNDPNVVEMMHSDESIGASQLVFRRVRHSYGGNYTCIASNQHGTAAYSAVMNVKVPPSWRVEPFDREAVVGEQITIDCQANGNPRPFIRWKFTPATLTLAQLQPPANLYHSSPSSNLYLANGAVLQAAGSVNSASAQTNTNTNSNNNRQLDSQLPLQPAPFRLINSNHHVQTLENGSLAIRSLGREHAGSYICEAANSVAPNLVKQIRLIVRQPATVADDIQVSIGAGGGGSNGPSLQQAPPSVFGAGLTATGSDYRQTNGAIKTVRLAQNTSAVRLSCWPVGDSPMQIEWLKDDRLLHSHSTAVPTQVSGSASQSDMGATGTQSDTALGRYRVGTRWHPAPKVRAPPQQPDDPSFNNVIQQQQPQQQQHPLESELIVVVPLSRVDAAQYTCVVRNAYGSSERKLRLIVMEPPEAPQVVDVAHIASRSIGLRWSVPFDGNSPILKYIVEYKRLASSGHYGGGQANVADNLDTGNGHLFEEHAAVSSANTAPSRSEILVPLKASQTSVAAAANPNSPVQLIELVGQPNSIVAVPYYGHGAGTNNGNNNNHSNNNVLTNSSSGAAAASGSSAAAGVAQVHHTLHDLEPLTRYSIRVISVNAMGQSRPSVVLSLRTTEEVPSTVPTSVLAQVLSSRSIKLQWTIQWAPEHEIIEGFFVGYRSFDPSTLLAPSASSSGPSALTSTSTTESSLSSVPRQQETNHNETHDLPERRIISSSQSTFTYKTIRITNARPKEVSTQQQHHVDAANKDQASPSVDPSLLAPISTVTKTIPIANHHQHTGISSNKQISDHQQQSIVVSSFEYIISGLERNTEYSILIQCFNRKGAGPSSDPVVFRTLSHDPPEKLALNVDQSSEASLNLSWQFIRAGFNSNNNADSIYGTSLRSIMQLSAKPSPESEPIDGFVLAFAKHSPNNNNQVAPLGGANTQTQSSNKPANATSATTSKAVSGHVAGNASAIYLSPRISPQQPANHFYSNTYRSPQDLPSYAKTQSGDSSDLQWQAIQLGSQSRQHQLKNLECGTQYALKIWAYNKVGKGEPSDLLWTSTRGKAPVAPDKRSFLAINSTQVRLHLPAWYDGGCDIERFIVQYRARGQTEWNLVSNNILREQVNVIIRDLTPASPYELLVGAQNQVGHTEARYRFNTFDASGKPVYAQRSSSTFFGNLASALDDAVEGNEFSLVDYDTNNDNHATRRELWHESGDDDSGNDSISSPHGTGLFGRWLIWLRQVLNSSILLLFTMFVLVILLLLFVFNRSILGNGSSTGTLGSDKMSSSGGSGNGNGSSNGGHDNINGCENFVSTAIGSTYMDTEPALSVGGNGSITDSPRLTDYDTNTIAANQIRGRHLLSDRSHSNPNANYAKPANYASTMTMRPMQNQGDYGAQEASGAAAGESNGFGHPQHQQHVSPDMCSSYVTTINNNRSAACQQTRQVPESLKHLSSANPYASVHRSATIDPSSMLASFASDNHHRQQQQCLVQMLMMDAAAQQHQNGNRPMFSSLTLGKQQSDMTHQQPNKLVQVGPAGYLSQQQQQHQFANSMTLGRIGSIDIHQHQSTGCFGAPNKKTCDNNIPGNGCGASNEGAAAFVADGQHHPNTNTNGTNNNTIGNSSGNNVYAEQYNATAVDHNSQVPDTNSIYQLDAFNSAMTMSTSGRGTATSTFGGV